MGPCPRCGTRLLPGALACINCELPIAPAPAPPPAAGDGPGEPPVPPYAPPAHPQYSPYAPSQGGWPPYGAPAPPGYPQPGSPAGPPGPAPWTTNGLSIAALILSILWLGGLGSLLGVVFGHVSRGQIRRRPQRGAGMSLAALIIGYIGLAGSAVFYAELPNIVNSGAVQNVLVQEDIKDAASAERSYASDNGSFTNNAVDLADHGFQPIGSNSIYAAYNADVGYCLVGAHNGATTWYLYDSTDAGLSDSTFPTREAAELACSVTGIGDYVAIA